MASFSCHKPRGQKMIPLTGRQQLCNQLHVGPVFRGRTHRNAPQNPVITCISLKIILEILQESLMVNVKKRIIRNARYISN